MPGSLDFEFRFGKQSSKGGDGEGGRKRILLLGNFRGRRPEGGGLAAPRIHAIDVDEFDAVMGRLSPHLTLVIPGLEGPPVEIGFGSIDDFDADRLWRRLDLFAKLRDLKGLLMDPKTFAIAAAQLGATGPSPATPAEAKAEAKAEAGSDLDRLLGQRPAAIGGENRPVGVDISGFIRAVVAPHVVPSPDPRRDSLVAAVDAAAADLMRMILGHPDYRALEASWRSLWNLVTGVETDESLTLNLLDVSREEIEADLNAAGGEFDRWALWKLLVMQGPKMPGGEPFHLIAADLSFGPAKADLALLGALGVLASQAGGPLLAAARPEFLGISGVAGHGDPGTWKPLPDQVQLLWDAMRSAPMAPWIGLVMPRVLVRLPYGPGGEEIDAFPFDEKGYLWGSPAFAVAKLLARRMKEGEVDLALDDLPAHTRVVDGTKKLTAVAEEYFPESAGERILAQGIMPLMSYKNRPTARLLRLQSIAEPPTALRGFEG